MPGVIATIPKYQFSNALGVPMVNGTLEVYLAGTTTPTNTWQDQALSTLNTNPINLDSRGECILWLDSTVTYKFILKNAAGVIQWTVDNITNSTAFAQALDTQLRADLAASSGSSLLGFVQAGTGALATTAQAKMRQIISVKDFGATGDGTTDDTAAIQAAIVYAETIRNEEVRFPAGNYKITNTITIKGGIRLIGAGAMGAQTAAGVCLTHAVDTIDMLVWNGNHATTAFGVGGGIFNMQCVKGVGFSGGTAIKLLATDDSHRPGEFTVDNVLVWKGDGGLWLYGFHVDGTACNTSGSKGVRSIRLTKLRVADCSGNLRYVWLNQAVHVVSDYLQLDTGSGTGTCGLTVDGDSDNIILNGLIINGSMIINGSSAINVVLNGRIGALDVNNTSTIGTATIECNGLNNASTNFRVVSNLTDNFMATLTSNITDVTGDGTNYVVIWSNKIFDVAGSLSGGNFVPFCAGRYLFTWCIGYTGLTSSHTRHDTGLLHTRGGSTITSVIKVSNPYAQGSNGGLNYSASGSAELLLLEGDVVQLIANVSGGARDVDVLGDTTVYTWFSGQYVS